jgi:adenylate kinase
MLRAAIDAGTSLGIEIGKVVSEGRLVPDDMIVDLVRERLREDDCRAGYLFDGFPRTIPQAEAIRAAGMALDAVAQIDVDDAGIIERMSGRRVHLASGRTYHVRFNPPRVDGKDDETGEPLTQRDDDKRETVEKRLEIYHAQTRPLIDYYTRWAASDDPAAPRVCKVSGVGDVETITRAIFAELTH